MRRYTLPHAAPALQCPCPPAHLAYVRIREHTLAYVRIGEDTGGPVLLLPEEEEQAVSVDEDAEPEPKSTTAHMRIPTAEFAPFRAAASGKGSPARFQSAARIREHT